MIRGLKVRSYQHMIFTVLLVAQGDVMLPLRLGQWVCWTTNITAGLVSSRAVELQPLSLTICPVRHKSSSAFYSNHNFSHDTLKNVKCDHFLILFDVQFK